MAHRDTHVKSAQAHSYGERQEVCEVFKLVMPVESLDLKEKTIPIP